MYVCMYVFVSIFQLILFLRVTKSEMLDIYHTLTKMYFLSLSQAE